MLCIASIRAEAEAGPPVALPRSCVAVPFAFACMVKGRRSFQGSCHGVHPCRLVRSARVRVLCARATPQHQHESRETSFPRVYVASLPLVGWEGLERTLRDAYPDRLALHSMIVVEEDNAYSVFDFLPRQPKDPVTALTLLTGGSVEGLLRERLISSLPARRCQVLGTAKHKQAVYAARSFNAAFHSELQLFQNDCRTHSAALARHLVGSHVDVPWQEPSRGP